MSLWLTILMALLVACRAAPPTGGHLPGHDDIPLPRASVEAMEPVRDWRTTSHTYGIASGEGSLEFYRREMPARSWRSTGDDGSALTFEKPGKIVVVSVSDQRRPAVLLIRVTEL